MKRPFSVWLICILLVFVSADLAMGQCAPGTPIWSGRSTPFPNDHPSVFRVYGPNGENRYIDRSGKYVGETHKPDELKRGVTLVNGRNAVAYLDGSGAVKLTPDVRHGKEFQEGLAAAQKNEGGKWGFLDTTGKFAIEPQFYDAGSFSDGLAAVQPTSACQCSYIDKSGKMAVPGVFKACAQFSEGVAKVEVTDGHWGFIDKAGYLFANFTADISEAERLFFSEGLAPAERTSGGKRGFVNSKGEFVIEPQFDYVGPFSEGLAEVSDPSGPKENRLWGYIDKTGKYAIKPRFCEMGAYPESTSFREGLAFVCNPANHKAGFINREGRFVIAPRFELCRSTCGFSGGLAWVETDSREGYINQKGEWIWSMATKRGDHNGPHL